MITYYQNPDGSLAFHEADDFIDVTGGEIHEDAVELTLEQYDDAREQIEQDAADAIEAMIADAAAIHDDDIKLFRYLPNSTRDKKFPPSTINYITGIEGRLHPTNTVIVDGEIRQVDYYATASPPNAFGVVEYDDLVIRETFAYTRDAMGFARARTQTITWYTEDGEPHADVKTRVKYYENDESLREGQRRRANITDTLAMTLAGWLVTTQTQHANPQARIDMGREFMRFHKTSFDMFKDASSAQILYDVRDDAESAHEWLDDDIAAGVTVRAKILDDLNIWNLTL